MLVNRLGLDFVAGLKPNCRLRCGHKIRLPRRPKKRQICLALRVRQPVGSLLQLVLDRLRSQAVIGRADPGHPLVKAQRGTVGLDVQAQDVAVEVGGGPSGT